MEPRIFASFGTGMAWGEFGLCWIFGSRVGGRPSWYRAYGNVNLNVLAGTIFVERGHRSLPGASVTWSKVLSENRGVSLFASIWGENLSTQISKKHSTCDSQGFLCCFLCFGEAWRFCCKSDLFTCWTARVGLLSATTGLLWLCVFWWIRILGSWKSRGSVQTPRWNPMMLPWLCYYGWSYGSLTPKIIDPKEGKFDETQRSHVPTNFTDDWYHIS